MPQKTAAEILDASGLTCPMPLLKTKLRLNAMGDGERLEVLATDAGSARDIPAYIRLSRHRLEHQECNGNQFRFVILCGGCESGETITTSC
ncbi:MAG: sulfurtransferase TusA family protein [Halomonadaceae bacterium]|nr:MAG: sulfurtransferase TusA family protein [Halomonadaceae bacterium]